MSLTRFAWVRIAPFGGPTLMVSRNKFWLVMYIDFLKVLYFFSWLVMLF